MPEAALVQFKVQVRCKCFRCFQYDRGSYLHNIHVFLSSSSFNVTVSFYKRCLLGLSEVSSTADSFSSLTTRSVNQRSLLGLSEVSGTADSFSSSNTLMNMKKKNIL